jgi:hypothetical protein
MVSLLASSAVDRGYKCCSDPTKDSRTGNFMSKSKDWLVRYQHNIMLNNNNSAIPLLAFVSKCKVH